MPHVGIKRFGAGHDQDDAAEREKSQPAIGQRKIEGMDWIERHQHMRRLHDIANAEGCQSGKPDQHDRTENSADCGCATTLNKE
ncbi:MAG: hypothetical protein BWY57_01865 [Betaproteobacteria bacterium ADurb.Bin341]|nr:MAG: hypothetical protein BWY57_01865 [Betaproteobacteria bacterium ADurb.Bin341]